MAIQFNPATRGDTMPTAPASTPDGASRQAQAARTREQDQQTQARVDTQNVTQERLALRRGATFTPGSGALGTHLDTHA